MSLFAKHNEISFGVGDKVRVSQKLEEGDKGRTYVFEGIVIGIKGRDINRSFTVRKIGAQNVGIERIFLLSSPTIEKIEVTKKGVEGVQHAKLYYIREKSPKEVDKIFSRQAVKTANAAKKKH